MTQPKGRERLAESLQRRRQHEQRRREAVIAEFAGDPHAMAVKILRYVIGMAWRRSQIATRNALPTLSAFPGADGQCVNMASPSMNRTARRGDLHLSLMRSTL
jgi:hypothetical protein